MSAPAKLYAVRTLNNRRLEYIGSIDEAKDLARQLKHQGMDAQIQKATLSDIPMPEDLLWES